jgi:predicted amidohydrolase YtcJ
MTFYTKNVAYQIFKENELGRFEVGMRADFVILNQNPLTAPVNQIRELEILALYRKGQPVLAL